MNQYVPALSARDPSEYYIRPRRVSRPAARLLAFPYAGGAAVAYYGWAALLAPDIELVSMQYPGRGRLAHMPACKRVGDIVEVVYATVLTLSDVPLYVFGHSMGAIIAFEVVRRLRSRGQMLPKALFVSACGAPQLSPGDRMALHRLPDEEFLACLIRYGGIRQEILLTPEIIAFFMPLLRADMTAFETWRYEPQRPLAIPIVAMGGDQDETIGEARLQAWRGLTDARFECRVMPGGHFYFQDQLAAMMDMIHRVVGETIDKQ
jgi:surfactin synthase thioesterase subunit